jgi:hypothetical protein
MSTLPLLHDIKISDKIHISDEKNIKYKPVPIKNQQTFIKPCGLWYAYGNQWIEWVKDQEEIIGEGTYNRKYTYKLDITSKTANKPVNFIHITTFEELLIFDKLFGESILGLPPMPGLPTFIKWAKVAEKFDGIAIYNTKDYSMIYDIKNHRTKDTKILEIFKKLGLTNTKLVLPEWYRTWDIGSGCIWGDVNVNFTRIRNEDEGEGDGAIRDSLINRICCGWYS